MGLAVLSLLLLCTGVTYGLVGESLHHNNECGPERARQAGPQRFWPSEWSVMNPDGTKSSIRWRVE
jgi:hypothetical protein